MDAEEFIAGYGAAVDSRNATILIGAGMSLAAGYPDWSALLAGLRAGLGLDDAFDDLPLLAQYAENTDGGRAALVAEICAQLGSITPVPTENHHLIAQLPLQEMWTTNFDPLVEAACPDAAVVELDDDFIEADGARRRLYKMHGSIPPGATEPVGGEANLVISRDDFDRYIQNHPRFWQLLQAQMLTKSFLFVGFSLSDPNFDAVLKLVRMTHAARHVTHYSVLRRPRDGADGFDHRARDLRRSGVEVVEVTEHSETTTLLRRLVARTRPARLLVSGSQPGGGGTGTGVGEDGQYPASADLDDHLRELAVTLGRDLADEGVSLTTANFLGATVGYAMLDALGDAYEPERLKLVRRHKDEPVGAPNQRSGTIVFVGKDPDQLRAHLYTDVRAVLVMGGNQGARNEVEWATENGVGVVPLAAAGGTAREIWDQMRPEVGSLFLGGQPVDPNQFEALGSDEPAHALAAAVALIRQAMYLPARSSDNRVDP
jgi:hypothetical protein